MKLDKATYTALREELRQELVHLQRMRAMPWEINTVVRRLSHLDMAWARGEDWYADLAEWLDHAVEGLPDVQ